MRPFFYKYDSVIWYNLKKVDKSEKYQFEYLGFPFIFAEDITLDATFDTVFIYPDPQIYIIDKNVPAPVIDTKNVDYVNYFITENKKLKVF